MRSKSKANRDLLALFVKASEPFEVSKSFSEFQMKMANDLWLSVYHDNF